MTPDGYEPRDDDSMPCPRCREVWTDPGECLCRACQDDDERDAKERNAERRRDNENERYRERDF